MHIIQCLPTRLGAWVCILRLLVSTSMILGCKNIFQQCYFRKKSHKLGPPRAPPVPPPMLLGQQPLISPGLLLNWLSKIELRTPGSLVVNIFLNYWCTVVLLYAKNAKRNWRNNTLFITGGISIGRAGLLVPPSWLRLRSQNDFWDCLCEAM